MRPMNTVPISKIHSAAAMGRTALPWLTVVAAMAVMAAPASAISTRVKLACAKDYYAHCSKHAPGSPEVRSCMRAVGDGLSARCVNALAAEGELSDKEMARVAKNDN